MIVKFHARGAGRGSGPVEYLLGFECCPHFCNILDVDLV